LFVINNEIGIRRPLLADKLVYSAVETWHVMMERVDVTCELQSEHETTSFGLLQQAASRVAVVIRHTTSRTSDKRCALTAGHRCYVNVRAGEGLTFGSPAVP
jgi:hypothetical protein